MSNIRKRKVFGTNKMVYELTEGKHYITKDMKTVVHVRLPKGNEDLDDFHDSEILDLVNPEDEDSSEWFVIVDETPLDDWKNVAKALAKINKQAGRD